MTHESGTEHLTDPQAVWALARLLTMARVAGLRARALEQRLQAFDAPAVLSEGGAAATAAELRRTVADVFALQDGVDVMGFVANRLRGCDETVVVSAEELQHEAASALAGGSTDPSFVLLAVGMLPTHEGFPALADALAAGTGAVAEWGDLTVRGLLGAFQGSNPARARRVCATALVHPDTRVAGLDAAMIARLVGALRADDD